MDGKGILATDNLAVTAHPRWSHISVLDVSSNGTQFAELIWIDPAIWDKRTAFANSLPAL
ncbi:hypothetical protein MYCTH_2295563, partial [Thermothelomyces thermophilus ATCC 42464]